MRASYMCACAFRTRFLKVLSLLLLLSQYTVVESASAQGQRSLAQAAKAGDTERVRTLLRSGEDGAASNDRVEDGDTPLILAAFRGHVEVVKILLAWIEVGTADSVNYRKKDGDTALMRAAFSGHVEVVRLLLANGARVDDQHDNGASALMWAAYKGHADVVDILIEAGATPTLRMKDGNSAEDLARDNGFPKIEQVLAALDDGDAQWDTVDDSVEDWDDEL
eukprot:COSAG01_NODE_5304_length_4350_cov_8.058104_1_plen_222_part_00